MGRQKVVAIIYIVISPCNRTEGFTLVQSSKLQKAFHTSSCFLSLFLVFPVLLHLAKHTIMIVRILWFIFKYKRSGVLTFFDAALQKVAKKQSTKIMYKEVYQFLFLMLP